jgi:purine-binding chemotaxis protein CheW
MPDYVKGVINLRGRVIPVIDLRTKFKLAHSDTHERTCTVVVQVNAAGNGRKLVGLIVDGVEEVAQVGPRDIEPTPDFGGAIDTSCLLGMAKTRNAVKMLLDIDKVVQTEGTMDLPESKSGQSDRSGQPGRAATPEPPVPSHF